MTSIGDFAESLISEELDGIKTGKVLPPSLQTSPTKNAPAGKDIRDIKVPNSFMQEVLGESYVPTQEEEIQPPIVEEEVEESPPILLEERVDELVSLLKDVKEMLSEMMGTTTTGMGGINFAPHQIEEPQCDDRERGYIKSTPAKMRPKTRKEVFKSAMKRYKR